MGAVIVPARVEPQFRAAAPAPQPPEPLLGTPPASFPTPTSPTSFSALPAPTPPPTSSLRTCARPSTAPTPRTTGRLPPDLTLNLGLRWEYGSPYSEDKDYISNFDPTSQTVLTINPGANSSANVTKFQNASGIYGKTLINPDYTDFAPRVGFAFTPDGKTALRGGFGTIFVHYTRAGSGDILAINAPQALFVAVNQNNLRPTPTNHCVGTPTVAQIGTCYVSEEQGFPTGLTTTFNPLTDNVTYVPKNTRDSYVESYFLSVQRQLAKNTLLDIAYVGNHGLKLQGFVNANQLNPAVGFGQNNRPFTRFSDITEALNEFSSNYNSLQVRYEQRATGWRHYAEFLHLVARARYDQRLAGRQHALRPGRQQHRARIMPSRTTTYLSRTSPAWFMSCPSGAAAVCSPTLTALSTQPSAAGSFR